MGNIIIETKNLGRTYKGRHPVKALREATFQIEEGEFIAIMGRSGSGKSTLLHQLGLLDQPTSGKLHINGINVLSLSSHMKSHFRLEKIGYVFQEFSVLNELTALENVYLPILARHKKPEGDLRLRAASLLELVGLGHRLHHYPSELSGGEQQRVVIARALINEPKIILADEPTANLDSQSANDVLRLFSKLNSEKGQTIVMISHEEEDKKWVDRVIRMSDGIIEKIEEITSR